MISEMQRDLGVFPSIQWLFIGLAAMFIFYGRVLSPVWISPLSKVPTGIRWLRFTSLWITWKRYSGKEFYAVESAFREKGQIARLGPRELGVNIIEGGIRTVYGRGYHNPSWYDHFINYGLVYHRLLARISLRDIEISTEPAKHHQHDRRPAWTRSAAEKYCLRQVFYTSFTALSGDDVHRFGDTSDANIGRLL